MYCKIRCHLIGNEIVKTNTGNNKTRKCGPDKGPKRSVRGSCTGSTIDNTALLPFPPHRPSVAAHIKISGCPHPQMGLPVLCKGLLINTGLNFGLAPKKNTRPLPPYRPSAPQ